MNWLVNGRPGGNLDIADRGLHYGDGLFETMSVAGGRARYFERHMQRLERGCRTLKLPAPSGRVVAREIRELCGGNDRHIVKLILTRGPAERGYAPPDKPEVTRIVLRYPWPAHIAGWQDRGVRVRLCNTRLAISPQLGGIKHLNRLEQVLARAEWNDPEITEGLMSDSEGCLVEAVAANVFLVRKGRLRTPLLDRCGVAGVMRDRVIELAELAGVDCGVARIGAEELDSADEIFLTNVVAGIVPVATLGDRRLTARRITNRLLRALSKDDAG